MDPETAKVRHDPLSTKPFSDSSSSSTSAEEIPHEIAFVRSCENDSLQKLLRLLRTVINPLLGLSMDHVYSPHITARLIGAHHTDLLASDCINYRNTLTVYFSCL